MRKLLASTLFLIIGLTSPAMCRPVSICIASSISTESSCQKHTECDACQQTECESPCCLEFDDLPDSDFPAPLASTPLPSFYLLTEMDPVPPVIHAEDEPRSWSGASRAPPPGPKHRAILEIWNL